MRRNTIAKSGFIALLLMVVGTALYLYLSTYSIEHASAGPWRAEPETPDVTRDAGFDFIAKQTGIDPRRNGGLKFFYSWPHFKWLAISTLKNGPPQMAILDSDPSGNTANLSVYRVPNDLYLRFLNDFDRASAGYGLISSGFDGQIFAYERWKQHVCAHDYGNASFSSRDRKINDMIHELAAKVDALGQRVS